MAELKAGKAVKRIKRKKGKSIGRKAAKKVPKKNLVPHDEDMQFEKEIVIDRQAGLVFYSEKELFEYFKPTTQALEKEYEKLHESDDIAIEEFADYEDFLPQLLSDPDEVWVDEDSFENMPVIHYIREFENEKGHFNYVALVFVADDLPAFIFLHFPTNKPELVDHYRRTECLYDRNSGPDESQGALEGDALAEGDPLAVGLYESMLKVRSETDIPESQFLDYAQYRDQTIEDADEIWRSADLQENILVTFIKNLTDLEKDLYYVVITVEDPQSDSHYLLFSFPTNDESLLDRYKHGENLQAEEVVRSESH